MLLQELLHYDQLQTQLLKNMKVTTTTHNTLSINVTLDKQKTNMCIKLKKTHRNHIAILYETKDFILCSQTNEQNFIKILMISKTFQFLD